jgi:hypothetical protein
MLAYQIAPCAVVVDGVTVPLVEDSRKCTVVSRHSGLACEVRVMHKDMSRRALVWDRKVGKQITRVYPQHLYDVTLPNYRGEKVIVQQTPHVTINVRARTNDNRWLTPQVLYQ